MVVCKSQGINESAFETLGSTGLFEGVGSSSSSRNDPNPTVRIPISRICNLTQHGLKLPSGLRRQFQADVSFFCFFCTTMARPTRRGLLLVEGKRARRQRTRRLLSPCGVSTRSRRSLRTRTEGTSAGPGQNAPQISVPGVLAVDRGARTR